MVLVNEVADDGKEDLLFHAPAYYYKYLLHLIYRRYALATILHHDPQLPIKPYRRWVTLAQNYMYVTDLWNTIESRLQDSSTLPDSTWRCDVFDRYIVTEVIVRRHEPVYVNEYRCRRTDQMLNISQASVDDTGSNTRPTSANIPCGLVGHMAGKIPKAPPSLDTVRELFAQALIWYDDEDRPTIYDPYTMEWQRLKWAYKDPFDPQVDDTGLHNGGMEGGETSQEEGKATPVEELPVASTSTAMVSKTPAANPKGGKVPTIKRREHTTRKRNRSGSGTAAVQSPPRKRPGFEVCNHTCQPTRCINQRTQCILTAREGSSTKRHSVKAHLHPGCMSPCPVADPDHRIYVRNATPADHAQAIKQMVNAGQSSQQIDEFFARRISSWNVGLVDWTVVATSGSPNPLPDHPMDVDDAQDNAEDTDAADAYEVTQELSVNDNSPVPFSRALSAAMSGISGLSNVYATPTVMEHPLPHTLELLYIPDPSRARSSREEAMVDLGWVKRNLTPAQVQTIQGLRGFRHKAAKPVRAERNAPGITMYLTEWLWMVLCLSEYRVNNVQAFNISYMLWEDFKATLINPRATIEHEERWRLIHTQDCIIGGIVKSGSSPAESGYNSGRGSVEQRGRLIGFNYSGGELILVSTGSAYQLHGTQRANYEETLSMLMRVVHIWPPVPSVRMAAHKWRTVRIMEMAAYANGWQRPHTDILTDSCEIREGTILKRSHSNCGNHVILPEQVITGSSVSENEAHQQLRAQRSWTHLNANTHSGDEQWVSQEYVETLRTLGEWRCFLVGGHIINIVHTFEDEDGNWVGRRAWRFMSLKEIHDLWANRDTVPVTPGHIVNPEGGDRRVRTQGMGELQRVVDETYRELVRQESNPTGAKSSLAIFCRIDVGLIFDADGNPSYFVNEVERTPTMSMWLKTVEDTTLRGMLDTLARVLHNHLMELGNPYTY
ncbi:hypothetical protein BU15DRAFT_82991 [Melanogaster broomeanus]|nr:hypothetical protein BU15DRAFT_82991 [Melanogaster broomeanus]